MITLVWRRRSPGAEPSRAAPIVVAPGLIRSGLIVAVLALAACGTDTTTSPISGIDASSRTQPASASPAGTEESAPSSGAATAQSASWPDCRVIWVPGDRLPRRYRGCLDGATSVPAQVRNCSSGGRLVIYGNRFYAALGGPINQVPGQLATDQDFQQVSTACAG
ncbi:MAG: hypothetical protein ACRCYU_02775 [Nocardioides sp.]